MARDDRRARPRTRERGSRRSRSHSHSRSRSRSRGSRRSGVVRYRVETSRLPAGGRQERRCWFAVEYDPVQVGSIDGTDTTPHDRALVRAQNAQFDPARDPQIEGDPYSTLFVARLNFSTTEETLTSFFEQYGPIRRLRLVRDKKTNKSKGYAFVEFERERDFECAYRQTHRQLIDGAAILVDYERSRVMKGWKPRRLGGGFGGRKESGQLRFGGRDRPFKPPLI